jgi:hypothetical protein
MRPDTTMKYMILLYDNADMREIFSSRSDLMEEMDGLLEEIRQSGELAATEPLADPLQTKTVRPADGPPVVTDGAARRGQGTLRRLPDRRLRDQ